jgi:hypothetical protein
MMELMTSRAPIEKEFEAQDKGLGAQTRIKKRKQRNENLRCSSPFLRLRIKSYCWGDFMIKFEVMLQG